MSDPAGTADEPAFAETDAPDERPDPGSGAPGPDPAPGDGRSATVEELVDDLERVARERDEYLDAWRRTQADFENFKKRSAKDNAAAAERLVERLVEQLLPVLDACDAAIGHGEHAVTPVFGALLGALEKEGLERIDPLDGPFDPNRHEAVMHEPSDDGEPTVVEVLRLGYGWKGRIVRPAMVRVKG